MRAETSVNKIRQFMVALGKAVSSFGRIYFTDGVSAVLLGWRETTIDIDLKAEPEPEGFLNHYPDSKTPLISTSNSLRRLISFLS